MIQRLILLCTFPLISCEKVSNSTKLHDSIINSTAIKSTSSSVLSHGHLNNTIALVSYCSNLRENKHRRKMLHVRLELWVPDSGALFLGYLWELKSKVMFLRVAQHLPRHKHPKWKGTLLHHRAYKYTSLSWINNASINILHRVLCI